MKEMLSNHCSSSPSHYFLCSVSSVGEEPSGSATAVGPPVVALPAATAALFTPLPTPIPRSQQTAAAATRQQPPRAAATVTRAEADVEVRTRTETLQSASVPALRLTAVSMATTIPTRPTGTLGIAVKF